MWSRITLVIMHTLIGFVIYLSKEMAIFSPVKAVIMIKYLYH